MPVTFPSWLPPLVTLAEYDGNWASYERAIYGIYDKDFLCSYPALGSVRVKPKKGMIGRHNSGFWHLISSGPTCATPELDRDADISRCERIAWPRAIIDSGGDSNKVRQWENERRTKTGAITRRVLLALPDFSYLVVLDDDRPYLVLWTAYIVYPKQRGTLEAEWRAFTAKKV